MFKNKNFSLDYIIPFLMFSFCGCYISCIAPISPVFLFFYSGIIYFFFNYICKIKRIKITKSALFGCGVVLYIVISQLLMGNDLIKVFGAIVPIMFYIMSIILFPKLSEQQIKRISEFMLFISTIWFSVDTIYRLMKFKFNILYMLSGFNFYASKKMTLLYADTNTVGINAVVFVFFSFYLYRIYKNKRYLFYTILFTLINILSLSRSSIFAEILTLFLIFLYKNIKMVVRNQPIYLESVPLKKIFASIIIFISIVVAIYCGIYFVIYLLSDGSFGTKINLFETLITFLFDAPIESILCGIGFNTGLLYKYGSVIGYAHTYLLTYIVETGIIGYIFVTGFLISILLETKSTIIQFIPFFIYGLSLVCHAQLHVFYTVLGIMWYYHRINKRMNRRCIIW